jgi:hypothetical protein
MIDPMRRFPAIRCTWPSLFVADNPAGRYAGLRGAESRAYDTLLRTQEPRLLLPRIENADALRPVGVAAVGEEYLVGCFSPE